MYWTDIAWENLATQEIEDRRNSHRLAETQATRELAQRTADLSFTYPDLSGGVVTGLAMGQADPMSEQVAAIARRNAQLEAAGFDPQPARTSFWDVGLGRDIKGVTRGAFTVFQSMYDEVVKGGSAFLTEMVRGTGVGEAAQKSFGFSPGAMAIASARQGRPINLGSGFFAGGDLSAETQRLLDQGVPLREAMQNPEQVSMGLPLGQFSQQLMSEKMSKVGTGANAVTVTPGRAVASIFIEPGEAGFSNFSGLIDFASNIFLDPANIAGGFIGDLAASNKMLGASVASGARHQLLKRGVDEWLQSGHGGRVTQWLADQDDYANIYGLFKGNARKSHIDANFVEQVRVTRDVGGIKNLLSTAAEAGILRDLPVRQSLIGRVTGSSGLTGALSRTLGQSGKSLDVTGLRHTVRRNGLDNTFMGRWSAQVGARTLRVDNVSQSVNDFGEWLRAAGFKQDRVSHYMSRMAQLHDGDVAVAPIMYGLVKEATAEFGQQLVKEGIPAPVARAFTTLFDSVEDYRKFWIDNAGNPVLFPGSRYTMLMNGQLMAIPDAHLFTEFLDHAVPLVDMRMVRKAMSRKRWAKVIGERAGQTVKKVEGKLHWHIEDMDDFNKLGPGAITKLADWGMRDIWKPLVLLRIAWPVRVVGEEQVRLLMAGLDPAIAHPIHGIAVMLGYGKEFLSTDVKGESIREAADFGSAMSRRGLGLGDKASRNLYSNEWIKVTKADPRYHEGMAIQLQQLADEPIASRIAQALLDAGDETPHFEALKAIKEEFASEAGLGELRKALAADGKRWELLNIREAADKYIDSVMARNIQMSGGEWVRQDHIRGEWFDMWGNPLVKVDGGYQLNDGRIIQLERPTRTGPGLERGMGGASVNPRLLAPDFQDDMDFLRRLIDRVRTGRLVGPGDPRVDLGNYLLDLGWVDEMWDDLRLDLADSTRAEIDDLWQELDDFINQNFFGLEQGREHLVEQMQDMSAAYLERVSSLADNMAQEATDMPIPSGSNTRAMDIIISGGSKQDVKTALAGYEALDGQKTLEQISDLPGWTKGELAAALHTPSFKAITDEFQVRAAPAHIPQTGKHIYTESLGNIWNGGDGFQTAIVHDGQVTGHILWHTHPDGTLADVDMIEVARKISFDEAGDFAGSISQHKDDAHDLLMHVFASRMDTLPDDVMNVTFGGATVREWLASGGIDPKTLTTREMIEKAQNVHGAAWSSRAGDELANLPSITLSPQGAALMAKYIKKVASEEMYGSAWAWKAQNSGYQVIKSGDQRILKAIATGKLEGGLSISTRGVLDEVERAGRFTEVGKYLRENYGDVNFPEFTKIAKEVDPNTISRWDKAVDHLFNMLMSRPTNALSRSPAFKQFYWKRIGQLMPYMDEATQAAALKAAREAGVGRGDLRSMVSSLLGGDADQATRKSLEKLADDFTSGKFTTGNLDNLDEVDEIAKAFALTETQTLLYDLSNKSNFFDMTRNIFPFGEAWLEIMTTWSRLILENPRLIRRMQQGIEGARDSGFFYEDPATGEEVFSFLGTGALARSWGGFGKPDNEEDAAHNPYASPIFTGRVEGVNLILNNFLPGVGPVVQIPMGNFARGLVEDPDMKWLRDFVFPFGVQHADTPGGIVDNVMPAWFRKAMTAVGNPTGDDIRLFNNTVIDVLRAMEINGEIPEGLSGADQAVILEEATKRARRIYAIRAFTQFIGPTGAQVRWDVEVDPDGTAFAYQVLSTAYREMIEDAGGDRSEAFQMFVNQFGFDPAGIATAKTESIRARSVTAQGVGFQERNKEVFEDYPFTAYYLNPDDPSADFDYGAYLKQLEAKDRVGLSPEEWWTERNRLLGGIAYERVRRNAVDLKIRNKPEVSAWLRAYRYQLMEHYPGYGYPNVGVAGQADKWQVMEELKKWRDDPRMTATDAGAGLDNYLRYRDMALGFAFNEFGISEKGFGGAKSTLSLREWLLGVAQSLIKEHPDFGAIWMRHFAWEVEDPEPVPLPTSLAGVDLTSGGA